MVTVRVPRSFPVTEFVLGQRIRLVGSSATGDAEYNFAGVLKELQAGTLTFCLTLKDVSSFGRTLVKDGDALYFEPRVVTSVK